MYAGYKTAPCSKFSHTWGTSNFLLVTHKTFSLEHWIQGVWQAVLM